MFLIIDSSFLQQIIMKLTSCKAFFKHVTLVLYVVGPLMCDADTWMATITAIHNETCPSSQSSCTHGSSGRFVEVETTGELYCCGFCQCGPDCLKYGMCCPEEFEDLASALSVEERYVFFFH